MADIPVASRFSGSGHDRFWRRTTELLSITGFVDTSATTNANQAGRISDQGPLEQAAVTGGIPFWTIISIGRRRWAHGF